MIYIQYLFIFNILAQNYARSLTDVETLNIDSLSKELTIAVIFQPDCHACKNQMSELNCLKDKYKIILFGAFATEKKLRQEYRKLRTNLPAFYANNEVLKKIKVTQNLTPQIINLTEQPTIVSLGFESCENLKAQLIKN